MKRFFLSIVLLAGFAGASLFAWNPSYLLTYPSCTKAGDWQLNFGVGLPNHIFDEDYVFIPTARISFDKNTPLGGQGLPFFFGGIIYYRAEGWKNPITGNTDYTSRFSGGFRVGYHFNWGVDRLDTYIVSKAGVGIDFYHHRDNNRVNYWPLFGTHLGARWYVNDWFGFWIETGYSPFSIFDIGLTFKF
jgi:hypothetical protein